MMLLDFFWVFGWILEKGTKSANLGNFGVLHHDIGIPHSGVAEREAWTFAKPWRRSTPQRISATTWRSTIHKHMFLSCFVIPLFR